MNGIKQIEQVFHPFSPDKSPLAVVHIDGNKSKTGLPFKIQPTASYNCLGRLICTQHIQDYDKNEPPPSIIRI